MPVAILSLSFRPLLDYCFIKREQWLPWKHLPAIRSSLHVDASRCSDITVFPAPLRDLSLVLSLAFPSVDGGGRPADRRGGGSVPVKAPHHWGNSLQGLLVRPAFHGQLICFSLNIRGERWRPSWQEALLLLLVSSPFFCPLAAEDSV